MVDRGEFELRELRCNWVVDWLVERLISSCPIAATNAFKFNGRVDMSVINIFTVCLPNGETWLGGSSPPPYSCKSEPADSFLVSVFYVYYEMHDLSNRAYINTKKTYWNLSVGRACNMSLSQSQIA